MAEKPVEVDRARRKCRALAFTQKGLKSGEELEAAKEELEGVNNSGALS